MLYTVALKTKAEEPVKLSSGKNIILSLKFFQRIVDCINPKATTDEDGDDILVELLPIRDSEDGTCIAEVYPNSAYLKGHTLYFQIELDPKDDKEIIDKINSSNFYPSIPSDISVVDVEEYDENDREDYDDPIVVMRKEDDNTFTFVDATLDAVEQMHFFLDED